MYNELVHIFQGIRDIYGIETRFFINHHKVTHNLKFTYWCIVLYIKPHNKETQRFWLVVGINKIKYDNQVFTSK